MADFGRADQRQIPITGDIPPVMAALRARLVDGDAVVMVSGDPGYYSLLDALRRTFPIDRIEVVPGISSLQLAFARLALPWHGACLLSFHGREPLPAELTYAPAAVLGMLTDGKNNSQTIAVRLLQHGWHDADHMYICTRLSYEDERIVATTLGAAVCEPAVGHGVIIVCANEENIE